MAAEEFNLYSGLEAFGENSYDKELELCKKAGADMDEITKHEFNALQLAEIRKGLDDKIDVSQYMDESLSWIDMEEIRLELLQKIDLSEYRNDGFDTYQLSQIRQGIEDGVDVSKYASHEYLADQMKEIRLGLSHKIGGGTAVPVIFYLDPAFESLQMREIRKGLESGIDISSYASVSVPYMKMRAIRESAEAGLVFDKGTIERYNASILIQMYRAFLDGIDISEYVNNRFDAEQLEEIRLCKKKNIPIDDYITDDMRGDAIREIRLGLEEGIDVSQYSDSGYGWQQMKEMRIGLEHQIDISPYCKYLYQADQMREIRLGIEAGLDISQYSTMMYTATDMRRIRTKMLTGEFYINADRSPYEHDDMASTGNKNLLLINLLKNRDSYLSISEDNMLCQMTLPVEREDGYTVELIMEFLDRVHILSGIDQKAIGEMLDNRASGAKFTVATGKEPVDGVNGYYEYFFDTNINEEPAINPDGTVDLTKVDILRQVKVGDKLAVYHRATRGEDGYDVKGTFLKANSGKEIPIIKGNGFMIMNDRITYVATSSGAISMKDGNIDICKLLVMHEVKIIDKKVKYDGIVYIEGDVNSGSAIEATGDVIVGGHMESSEIISGGNVMVKGGVTCPIRGGITAAGDISAKYFEGARLYGNNISASYFINCTIEAKGLVKTYGRSGALYGGITNSLYGIEVAYVGNKTGAKTIINLGVNGNILPQYNKIKKTISLAEGELETLRKEQNRLKEMGAIDREQMQWKVKINAAVGSKEKQIKELIRQKEELEQEINKGNSAKAVITETAFAGVVFIISGIVYKLSHDRKTYDKMTFKTDGNRENIVVV